MRILLTGATGYIGKRLLPALVAEGHEVICCTRDRARFHVPAALQEHITVVELDFLDRASLAAIPTDIDAAYYLMHSMASSADFQKAELQSAVNFRETISATGAKQVIYLTGIINEAGLSEHLASRKAVEDELGRGSYHLTCLRAGIIIGSGSASFEIIRDLVEKLPVMIAPKWLRTRCQPIAIRDVITFLTKSLGASATYDRAFDIGGPGIYTYKEMLMGYAKVRGLKRWIGIVPVMTPRLSSYWLYFVTSTSYRLATSLVDSMKVEVVCRNTELNDILGLQPIDYGTALQATLQKIEGNDVASGWKDSFASSAFTARLSGFLEVPTFGCLKDRRSRKMAAPERTRERIWRIGGSTGWYAGNILWRLRGFTDKMVGGVGLNRGRTHADTLMAGDSVDFWRVLYANKEEGRLLLFAEMKLPGEAWLEFKMEGELLWQTATFRPKGVWGRLYWYAVLPFHGIVFKGLLAKLTE
ncbi:MAG: SDR family oxidoreductase [Flavobacteriales bacterium]